MTRRSLSRAGSRRASRVLDGGRRIDLARLPVVGEGGEAIIYALGGGRVAKVFKTPDHPDFAADASARAAAELRLDEHQTKLAAFPVPAPPRLVAPSSVLRDEGGRVVGYAMPFIDGADLLIRYGERSFREGRVPDAAVCALFRDLHATLVAVHRAGIVVGDLNDLNILARGSEAWLIDADSMQFGGYRSRVFTERFLDPALAAAGVSRPVLDRPYDEAADWYAFACLLMQSLLYVGPFGGVYRPRSAAERVAHPARPLHRISIFHPDVRYPKPARPLAILPDALIEHFRGVFEAGRRGPFPADLLTTLHWTACARCGLTHARGSCPACRAAAPVSPLPARRVRGTVTATRVARAPGPILAARFSADRLCWLATGPDGLVREDGSVIGAFVTGRHSRVRLRTDATFLGKAGGFAEYRGGPLGVETVTERLAGSAAFDANDRHVYWMADGALWRDQATGPDRIGDVARGESAFWVGAQFGLGYYRLQELTVTFVFHARARGLNDGVRVPRLTGQLVAAGAAFSDDFCWYFRETREQGRVARSLAVVAADGAVVATVASEDGDAPWWAGLPGACAAGTHLFVPTDDGIVRLTVGDGAVRVTADFPDTEPFVSGGQRLLPGPGGIHAIAGSDILRLQIR
ncbi:MAG TPA: hypothetical protein VM778_07970 [Gemmatimonadota bacterium]|nr:hypothetical protein [Gemmatimonadota bacterium]